MNINEQGGRAAEGCAVYMLCLKERLVLQKDVRSHQSIASQSQQTLQGRGQMRN